MAAPKKKKGFRRIVVQDIAFNWKFHEGIDIRPDHNKNNELFIDNGWYDDWLFINDNENKPPNYQPKTVTPNFVKESIEFALKNGWNTENKTGKLEIEYKVGKYNIKPNK